MNIDSGVPAGAPPQPQGKGCFYYGCITTIVFLLLLSLISFIAYKKMTSWLLSEFTSEQMLEIPVEEVSSSEYLAIREKVFKFGESVQAIRTPQAPVPDPLILSSREINALISNAPELKELRGRLHIAIDRDVIRARVSLPLDQVGFPGRFVNGDGTLAVSFDHGSLFVSLKSLTVNNRNIPEQVMSEIQKENLARELSTTADKQQLFRGIRRVRIDGGLVTVEAE